MPNRSVLDKAPTVHIGARVDGELWMRWRMYCMQHRQNGGELLKELITEFLDTHTQNSEGIER